MIENLYKKILLSDRLALSKAITLIESTKVKDKNKSSKLIKKLYKKSGKSLRIGVSGPPGVGKSTFIESLGIFLTNKKNKVAVLAVDPSSKKSGGSILGDKTRMQELSVKKNAFIRPSPSGGELGGVARRTRESMVLVEAAGYEVILIETVGVGQSETEVAEMVDIFLVLLQPSSGDELQGIKKGIIEIADILVVNKEDEFENEVKQTVSDYKNALSIIKKENNSFTTKVVKCSALNRTGIGDIWKIIQDFKSLGNKKGWIKEKRTKQLEKWMWDDLQKNLFENIRNNKKLVSEFNKLKKKLAKNAISPTEASKKILQHYTKNNKS
ncbi:MAG: GTPase ArgK [Alphaproteobacteria bacterium MarineAlpha6_Bin4]|nr:MAG: GTPase ArgK [Alphaproteobacteria bacterium MarineAlpha6_Bin3]PPR38243.1 MAG: GTPase ArgK [Alphaproteobacteria bacterium MarineAlpha6_Bin4]|tara:strand:+ start:4132 stop:5109 length:978 start_codon:yes stop_codon:yes gene_type:complete